MDESYIVLSWILMVLSPNSSSVMLLLQIIQYLPLNDNSNPRMQILGILFLNWRFFVYLHNITCSLNPALSSPSTGLGLIILGCLIWFTLESRAYLYHMFSKKQEYLAKRVHSPSLFQNLLNTTYRDQIYNTIKT